MKKTKKIKIEIDTIFGSEFQQEFAEKTLQMLLYSWAQYLHSSHKKNLVIYRIEKK
jgi:hypothetical protein